jgi:hypothetical protein
MDNDLRHFAGIALNCIMTAFLSNEHFRKQIEKSAFIAGEDVEDYIAVLAMLQAEAMMKVAP